MYQKIKIDFYKDFKKRYFKSRKKNFSNQEKSFC